MAMINVLTENLPQSDAEVGFKYFRVMLQALKSNIFSILEGKEIILRISDAEFSKHRSEVARVRTTSPLQVD